MVLLDKKSMLIQGTITAHRLYSFKNLLSEGAVYELSVFYIARSNNHFKLWASPVCIRFTEHTSFVEVVLPQFRVYITIMYISDIFGQDRSIHTIYNDENESIQRVMVTIQLDRSTTVCQCV